MAVEDLADADPLPRVLAWLNAHPTLTAALGGPGRVDALNEAPYPRIRFTHSGGADGDLRWLINPEFQLEVLDDLAGTTGRAGLRRILYLAYGALVALLEQPVPPGEPVITWFQGGRGGGWSPLGTGQGRYVGTVRAWSHPYR
ncbi:MAG: hypothetical protein JWL97_4238 [Gemmatimonadales bacterium]|nr:hypothetical protein [Gemmatimonadales bacterium]